jgi:hypothetical protein
LEVEMVIFIATADACMEKQKRVMDPPEPRRGTHHELTGEMQ